VKKERYLVKDDIIFRALNDNNLESYKNQAGIQSKISFSGNEFKEAIKEINTHVTNGSNKNSCWISCSEDFNITVEEYSLPQNGRINEKRKCIAVIKNHGETCIKDINGKDLFINNKLTIAKDKLYKMTIDNISKAVYNLSDRSEGKKLCSIGLILKKDGSPCEKNVLALSYTTKNKEILVLGKIPQADIEAILTPLEIDLLYIFSKYKDSGQFHSLLCYLKSNKNVLSLNNYTLLNVHKVLFNDLYIQNRNMHDIAKALAKKYQGDVIGIYSYFRVLKREMLSNLLHQISKTADINISALNNRPVPIVEDTLDAIRIGDLPDYKPTYINYAGQEIVIKPLDIKNEPHTYLNAKRIVLAATNTANITNIRIDDENILWLYKNYLVKKDKSKLVNSKPLTHKESERIIFELLNEN